MKKLLVVCIAAAALCATPALAADMAVKAPPPVAAAPGYSWTGFYIGLEGGGAWGQAEQTSPRPFDSGKYSTSGGLFGGTVGYNWQSGAAVFGLETDLSWASIRGSTTGTNPAFGTCFGSPPNCNSKIEALGTVRGRLGYAWQNLLPYITGGLAYANLHGAEGTGGFGGSGSTWVAGWTIGGGLEAVIYKNWTAKLEYLYFDLGNQGVFTDIESVGLVPQSLRETAQVVRGGINYRFQ